MGANAGPQGSQPLLFALGESAMRHSMGAAGSVHWSLQRHDPDRDRWLEVGRFPSKDVASISMHALIAHDHGRRKDFRIRMVTIPPRA
jgi:hypothetical protein